MFGENLVLQPALTLKCTAIILAFINNCTRGEFVDLQI
jgi:hypothetical protein